MRAPIPITDPDTVPVQIQLLGAFRVRVGERAVADEEWRLLKARALVKLLALTPNHRLSREQVTDALWPAADGAAARRSFDYALHVARQALDRPGGGARSMLQLREGQLTMATPETLTVDVERFTAAAARARRSREPADYHAALAHYAGELLPDDLYEEWSSAPREILRESFLQVLVELARLLLARGEQDDALAALHQVLAVAPAHEEAHTLLMRAYDGAGQRPLALRQYAQLRAALQRELAVEPDPQTQQLYGAILAGQTRLTNPSDPPRQEARSRAEMASAQTVLPTPLTSFVGRERELAVLVQIVHGDMARARLVTMTGSGGCGKTRLAIEAVRRLLPHYPDRLWFVELAALDDPARVPHTIARSLQLRDQPDTVPTDLIIQSLRRQPVLLILDNCEHLAAPCARLVAALLGACPGLRILATSRVALHVAGELIWRVPALALPDPPRTTPFTPEQLTALAEGDAVRLFFDRATLRVPDFRLTTGNAAAVAAICRRLDGLPLALELAAGRLPALSVEELAARLDDALGVVAQADYPTPPRQQTLRATLDWSYALLTPHEAALLRRLAIFAGSWSLAAAEAICDLTGGEPRALDGSREDVPPPASPAHPSFLETLAQLVDQSLVTVTTIGGVTRYALLEIVRQYAGERPDAEDEATVIPQRHAAWYLQLAEESAQGLDSTEQVRWLRQLEIEHDNLRAALRWALGQDDAPLALRLCAALWRFWESHSYLSEGYEWCMRALSLTNDAPALRADTLLGAGRLAHCRNDIAAARSHIETVVAFARGGGDRRLLATALTYLGHVALIGDRAEAQRLYAESLALGETAGDRRIEALNLSGLGNVAIRREDYATARPLLVAALDRAEETGMRGEAAFILRCLGRIAFAQGELGQAQDYYERCIARWHALGSWREVAMFQTELAHLALAQGRHAAASQLLPQSLAMLRDLAIPQRFPYCLEGFATLALAHGQPQRALRLAAVAAGLRARHGSTMPEIESIHVMRALAAARATLGETASATAWGGGLDLALDDALAEALA